MQACATLQSVFSKHPLQTSRVQTNSLVPGTQRNPLFPCTAANRKSKWSHVPTSTTPTCPEQPQSYSGSHEYSKPLKVVRPVAKCLDALTPPFNCKFREAAGPPHHPGQQPLVATSAGPGTFPFSSIFPLERISFKHCQQLPTPSTVG